mgnify:CR=1 FL=1
MEELHTNSTGSKAPEAHDNVVAAFFRIIEFQYLELPAAGRPANFLSMVGDVFSKIPFEADMTENETVLKFSFKLYEKD